jgi:drug/metabolite transporter (DMT)-like permease
MASLAKYLGNDFHAFQIAFFRSSFSLIVILPFLLKAGLSKGGIKTKIPLLQITRGAVSAIGIILGFYAIVNMPLADAQAIRFSSALFVVPLAAIFLNEKVGIKRTVATLIGFFGVIVMLNPTGEYNVASLSALGAALAFAIAAIFVKVVSKYDKPVTLMFYSNIVSIPIMIIPALLFWITPNLEQLFLILLMAVCASIAHNFFIRAYAIGEASIIAPIDYVRLLASAAVDFLVFGIIFGINTLIGSSIIILSTLYIVRRESKIHKNQKKEFEQI